MRKASPLIWILKQHKQRLAALTFMTLASAVHALFCVLFALGSRKVIDSATNGLEREFLCACLLQIAIIVGILVSMAVLRHLKDKFTAEFERDWKRYLLRGLLYGDYASVSQYHSGELLNRLNNDVRIVNEGITGTLPNVTAMLTRLVSAMVILTALEPWFAAAVCAVGIIVILITGIMRRHLKELHKRVSEMDGKVSGFLQEVLEKLLIVQAMELSPEIEHRADGLLDQRYHIQRQRKNVSLFANSCVSIMSYGASFVALVWCAFGLLQGRVSFGSLVAVTQLVSQLQTPLVGLSGVIPQYIAATAAAERLVELEQIRGEPKPAQPNSETCYASMDSICGKGLVFSYDRERVLDNAEFSLPRGAFAAITGPSGIGKSTLLKLLLGVFLPEQGALYLNCGGKQIGIGPNTKNLFAYVPQGNLLLSGTLRDNLLIANPEATEDEISRALYISAMDDYLPGLPDGLETVLGENGAGLSEGQAQRLAIARAVLSNAPILLLDESTSALDGQTEKKVLERIKGLPNRTCIAVTHRPAMVSIFDWRLEMDDGKIHVVKNQ